MEPHAPKGQRTLFDEDSTKRKPLSNEQSREYRIRLEPDVARRVEEHERQHSAAIATQGRGRGRGRGSRENAPEPNSGWMQGSRARGRGAEPMEVSSESEEDMSEEDTDVQEERLLRCWESAKLREFSLNVMIGGASRKPNTRRKIIEIIWRPRVK